MKFQQLDDFARDRARSQARAWFISDTWWEPVYDDARRVAALLGIDIDSDPCSTSSINFDDRQATFSGKYQPTADAVKNIVAYAPMDKELFRIASELTAFAIEMRLKNLRVAVDITATKRGMRGEIWLDNYLDGESCLDETTQFTNIEHRLSKLFDDFAAWIMAQLAEEEAYRLSDECIDEELSQHEFDVHGSII